MVNQTEWNDRKFNFDFPVGVYPCLVARLKGAAVRLEEIVASLPKEMLTKPVEGGWTIQEHIGHFKNVDVLHVARLDDYDNGAESLTPPVMTDAYTPSEKFKEMDVADILKGFRADREAFVIRLEVPDEAGASRSAHHPRLDKPMRVVDMVLFAAEHDEHHFAKIAELARG